MDQVTIKPTQYPWTANKDPSIEAQFVTIQLQFMKQHEHNVDFNNQFSSIENTAFTVDGKMDHL